MRTACLATSCQSSSGGQPSGAGQSGGDGRSAEGDQPAGGGHVDGSVQCLVPDSPCGGSVQPSRGDTFLSGLASEGHSTIGLSVRWLGETTTPSPPDVCACPVEPSSKALPANRASDPFTIFRRHVIRVDIQFLRSPVESGCRSSSVTSTKCAFFRRSLARYAESPHTRFSLP